MKKLEGVIHTHRKNKVSSELAVSHQSYTTALSFIYTTILRAPEITLSKPLEEIIYQIIDFSCNFSNIHTQ